MPNNNLSKSKQKEIKDLIEKGRNQGFLTLSEINDLLPTSSYDSDQIDGIIKLITDLKIKHGEILLLCLAFCPYSSFWNFFYS